MYELDIVSKCMVSGGGTCICNYDRGNRVVANGVYWGNPASKTGVACMSCCCDSRWGGMSSNSYSYWNDNGVLDIGSGPCTR